MFRELTRKNKQIPNDECIRILTEEKRGVLSVNGDDGYPYGMPMNHFYNGDDGCIYFHCGKQTSHRLDSVKKCDKVSFCVYDSGTKEDGGWALTVKSVIVFGRMSVIDDMDTVIDISAKLSRKFTGDEAYISEEIRKYAAGTLLLKLVPEYMCGKVVKES